MKKITILLGIIMFFTGLLISTPVRSDNASKIAVVDVQTVVNKSAQVKELKKEQAAKTEELQKWLNVAKADVDKQKTKEGKQKLLNKYNEEYAKKQESISKNYKDKLSAIDKSITNTISQQAKAKGYDVVISKNVVIYGGADITEAVAKVVK